MLLSLKLHVQQQRALFLWIVALALHMRGYHHILVCPLMRLVPSGCSSGAIRVREAASDASMAWIVTTGHHVLRVAASTAAAALLLICIGHAMFLLFTILVSTLVAVLDGAGSGGRVHSKEFTHRLCSTCKQAGQARVLSYPQIPSTPPANTQGRHQSRMHRLCSTCKHAGQARVLSLLRACVLHALFVRACVRPDALLMRVLLSRRATVRSEVKRGIPGQRYQCMKIPV
mmetsp:Transcript_15995/g.43588  ORF Transcript_15995/g.43588 Transcript_15995/m.43588 type:complete len:230 (+) Transcript_15995:1248-1937(+)